MSWGTELWDKYGDLCSYTSSGIEFLESTVAAFAKERGRIECEYAKSLRGLVKKYSPKNGHKNNTSDSRSNNSGPASINVKTPEEEEFTHLTGFKQMLQEVGYQAGQHEVLAEHFAKECYKHLHEEAKQLKEKRRRNMKASEKVVSDLKAAFKSMEGAKEKFRKAYEEQERSVGAYEKANNDGSVTRNELEKLRLQASNKTSNCETLKCNYAGQLVKTNDFRRRYYSELLPGILSGLQDLERRRIELIRDSILACVAKEREVQPIISGCHDSIHAAMQAINPDEDTDIVIERYKSGDIPPGDFKFEDMHNPQTMLSQDALADNRATNLNLYPRKKELERQIAATEQELHKSQKELKSLQQMMATYQNQPKFGNSKQFKGEIAGLHAHIGELETALTSLRGEHADVEDKLEALRTRSPRGGMGDNSPALSSLKRLNSSSRGGSSQSNSSTGSIKSGSLSIASGSQHQPVYDVPEHQQDEWNDVYDEIPPPPPIVVQSPSSVDTHSSMSMSSPSVTSSSSMGSNSVPLRRCQALYDYNETSMQESNIPMAQGEEFFVVDDDCDGWTRVRRVQQSIGDQCYGDEGYVPTTYLRML